MLSDETIEYEAEQERLRMAALEVCDLMADGNGVKKACAIKGISPSEFFRRVKMHDDVKKAWDEARVVRAEMRIDYLDELSEDALNDNLNPKVYSAVAATQKWLIEKLLPETYGKKQSIETNVTYDGGVSLKLQALSDEDLLRLAALPPATLPQPIPLVAEESQVSQIPLEEQLAIEVEAEEIPNEPK